MSPREPHHYSYYHLQAKMKVLETTTKVENNVALYRTEKHPRPRNWPKTGEKATKIGSLARSTTTRDRNLQFRRNFSTRFFEFSPVNVFPFSPGFMCKLVGKTPQNVEKIARRCWWFGRERATLHPSALERGRVSVTNVRD